MKKIIVAVALFASGLWVDAVLQRKEPAAYALAGDGAGNASTPTSACGDVNGDGKLDISDAVFTLSFLFTGGPQPTCRTGPLPATGQTKCYDASGTEVACGEVACPGQDGAHVTGCPSQGRYIAPGVRPDGTILDTCTGLMWQKDTADISGDGLLDGNDKVSWCDALAYCEGLTFAKHDDWRLPNIRELQSLVDFGPDLSSTIDPVFGALPNNYWSSSSIAGFPRAWVVYFGDGTNDGDTKEAKHLVRAVRNAP
jgi:hypothetical protein